MKIHFVRTPLRSPFRGKSGESPVRRIRSRVQSILNLIVDRTEARFLSLRAPGTNTTSEKAEFEAEEDEEVGRVFDEH